MTRIRVVLDLDPELADDTDQTGMTERSFDQLIKALGEFGDIIEGPEREPD